MNIWRIKYMWYGSHDELIDADTIESALDKFKRKHPEMPGVAIYSAECVK